MGDYTSYTIEIDLDSLEPARAAAIRDVLEAELEEPSDEEQDGSLTWHDVRVGQATDIGGKLTQHLRDSGQDVDYRLWESPKYEWLGDVVVHRVGQEDLFGECGDDGQLLLKEQNVAEKLRTCTPEEFYAWAAVSTGTTLPEPASATAGAVGSGSGPGIARVGAGRPDGGQFTSQARTRPGG